MFSGSKLKKCLNTCVNGVLEFQFLFLNLSSKFPAGEFENILTWTSVHGCVEQMAHSASLSSGLPSLLPTIRNGVQANTRGLCQ